MRILVNSAWSRLLRLLFGGMQAPAMQAAAQIFLSPAFGQSFPQH